MGSSKSKIHKNARKMLEMDKTKDRNQRKRSLTTKDGSSLTNAKQKRSHSDLSSRIPKLKSRLNPKSRSVNDTDELWQSFYGKQHTIVTHKSPVDQMVYDDEYVSDLSNTSDFLLISSTDEDSETSAEETDDTASDIHEYPFKINEISCVFNICLWNDHKIEEFLTLIGQEKHINRFKLHAIKPNHLLLIDETVLKVMDIPITDRRAILKERDCFITCNKVIQRLVHLDVKQCDTKKIKRMLMDSKPILNKARTLGRGVVVKFIANRIKAMENQLGM
eukprot:136833_1